MLEFEVKVKNRIWRATERVKGAVKSFLTTEDGDTNFISIIVVLVIVLGLAAYFRKEIEALVTGWWTSISSSGADATKDWGTGTTTQ